MQDIEWETCLVEPRRDRELERYVRRALGTVPHWIPYFASCPWLVRASVELGPSRIDLVHTEFDLAEIIALVVSQDNSCRYCYAATRALLRMLGFSENRIRKLEQGLLAAELNARERLAIDFVRRISRANPLPSRADPQELREAGYEDAAIKELAFLAAINVFFNRASTLPAIPTEPIERLPDIWYMQALRPLLAWLFRARLRHGHPESLAPEFKTGPFSYLVLALDGLPIAKSARRLLDDAWNSPILTKRAKALVFAVVARGLGCPLSEEEACSVLKTEGLEQSEIEEILCHLASPRLDPLETAIVPFARETIWYTPVQIQRQAKKLRAGMTSEQFMELAGIAALANAVCRLSAVLDSAR